jgi:hypothetical protein
MRNCDISNIRVKKKTPSSAVAFRNIPGNLGAEILNNLNSVINILKERLALNFMSMKFKELLAQKCCDRLLLNKPVTTYVPLFNPLLPRYVLFLRSCDGYVVTQLKRITELD